MANPPGSILVTGANGSLGFEIVKRVLSTPGYSHHSGLYTVRDSSSIPAFRESLHLAVKTSDIPRYDVLALDLSDLSSVRETADIINKRVAGGELPRIQALILNAGWTEFTTQSYSKDGFDMAFATNYLGHWLLTLLLLKSMDTESGRIVIVSSLAHDPKAPQNHNGQLNDTKWTPMLQGTSQAIADGSWSTTKDDATWCAGCRRYAASKLCLLLMMPELQRRLDADPILNNISIVSVDPGTMPGNFSRRGPWLMSVFLFRIILPVSARIMALWSSSSMVRTTSQSAADVLQAAFPSEEQQRKGLHLDGSKPCTPSDEARNGETQGYLWQETIGYTQLQQGDTVLRNWK